jgi:ferredoxin
LKFALLLAFYLLSVKIAQHAQIIRCCFAKLLSEILKCNVGHEAARKMADMKVHIDREGCIGCTVCEALCPDVFKLAEDTKSSIVEKYRKGQPGEGEVGSDLIACVESARDSCPVTVIKTE